MDNILPILIGLGLLALCIFLIVGLVKDIKRYLAVRKERKNKSNMEDKKEDGRS